MIYILLGKTRAHRRKLMNPAFHNNVLKKYLEVTNRYRKEFIEYISTLDGNKPQNLTSVASKLILTIMTGKLERP